MFDSKSFDSFAYTDPDYEGNKKKKRIARAVSKTVAAIVLVAAISLASITGYVHFSGPGSAKSGVSDQASTPDGSTGGQNSLYSTAFPKTAEAGAAMSTAEIYKKAVGWVVAIGNYANYQNQFQGSSKEMLAGEGTGIIYSSDGYILTNAHVVSGASRVTITLNDGKEYDAKLIGADEKTDIAVVKIDATGLSAAEFGDSTQLLPGDTAIVIGNPLGEFADTITQGIISSVEREVQLDQYILNLLQIDAAVNPGNSGGPLLNSSGQVVGVVNAKISTENVEGIGFAIPSATAVTVANDLISYGYVASRPVLGISVVTYTDMLAQMYNHAPGVFIQEVYDDSAAKAAGLQAGDQITKFNGEEVTDGTDLTYRVSMCKVGDKVTVTVMRGGVEKDISVTLKAQS